MEQEEGSGFTRRRDDNEKGNVVNEDQASNATRNKLTTKSWSKMRNNRQLRLRRAC